MKETISIHYDYDAESPREWTDSILLANHSRYDFGVPNPEAGSHGSYEADFKAYLRTKDLTLKDVIYQPVYMYEHSGIALSTSPFSCPWDSGQLGYIYLTKKQIRGEYQVNRISPKLKEKIEKRLEAEISIYSDYVSGSCYGFIIEDEDGNMLDACGGFLGNLDDVKDDIKDHIPEHLHEQLEAIDYSDIRS